jgi:hypothetical protein
MGIIQIIPGDTLVERKLLNMTIKTELLVYQENE